MGLLPSKAQYSHGIRKSLKNIPYRAPKDIDIDFLAEQTGQSKNRIKDILEDHLKTYSDGTVNQTQFRNLLSLFLNEPAEKINQYSDNVFRSLGVPNESFITLNEFLITFALYSKADLRRKLEYAFNIYDIDNSNSLDPDEVKEIIFGILDLFSQNLENQNLNEVSKEVFDSLKVSEIVKKEDFINGLIDNKSITSVLSPSS